MSYTTPIKAHYSVEQQKERLPLYLREFYQTRQLDRVKIDENEIQGYFEYSFTEEKSYVKSPVRASDGSISNLDSYATFLTPRLVIKYNYMHISDYRILMQLLRSKNEFMVECYDIVLDKRVTHKMYFAPDEMPKIHQRYLEVLGVTDYTIELIGTNSSLNTVSVTYHSNPPTTAGGTDTTVGSDSVPKATEVVIGDIATSIKENAPSGWKFKVWNDRADGKGTNYLDGFASTLNDSLVLYAIWQSTSEYTLNYNYGLSAPAINADMTYKYSTPVVYGDSIGSLPTFEASPKVKYGTDTTEYTPYSNGAWYKTPTKGQNSVAVVPGEKYWIEQDSTIYLIYDVASYNVYYYLDGELYNTTSIQYGVSVPLPQLVSTEKTFDGWYTDSNYTNRFSGSMPPYSLTLYARWQ